jgi:hypothetical protein
MPPIYHAPHDECLTLSATRRILAMMELKPGSDTHPAVERMMLATPAQKLERISRAS